MAKSGENLRNCFQMLNKNIGRHYWMYQNYKAKQDSQQPQAPVYVPSYRTPYILPNLDENIMRHISWQSVDNSADIEAIGNVLNAYKIGYKIEKITQGPTLTQYTLSLANFRDYEKVARLEKSFRAALNKDGIAISQNGSNISIEVPCFIDALRVGDVLHDENYKKGDGLTVAIGRAIDGRNVLADIEDMRHVLVAGTSGSGKSVFIQGMIVSLLSKHTPDEIELYMVDPKMVEFSFYKNLAQCHVVTETRDAVDLLNGLTKEMDNRYRFLASVGARDIDSYNAMGSNKMKRIVVFIDELSDLIKTSKKAAEDAIVRIAQKARACGIHLVIATQYPVASVVTGLIKSNMPTKVCFKVTNATASCVMLGRGGAEKLIGKGDMLYQTEKDVNPTRLQAGLIEEIEINNIVYSLMQNQY